MNMNDAWKIVEELEAEGWWIELESTIPNSDPVVYECTFHKSGHVPAHACEFTAQEAIRVAAMLI